MPTDDQDLVINLDDSPSQAAYKRLNESARGYEKSVEQAAQGATAAISGSAEQQVRVTQKSLTTQDRLFRNFLKTLDKESGALKPLSPEQRLSTARTFAEQQFGADPQKLDAARAGLANYEARLKTVAAAETAATQAAAQHAARMRSSGEQLQRLRDGIDAYNRKQGERRQVEERIAEDQARTTASMQRLNQQMELMGRTPLDRQLLSLKQQFEETTLGVNKNSDAYKKLEAGYQSATRRIKEQASAQKTLSQEFKNGIERLGAAFVAYNVLNVVMRKGILDTAIYAARTETLGVALNAAARANNLNAAIIQQQEENIKKLGITTQEARESLVRMITVQLDTAKATELARLAQDAAVISNINSSEAFSQMIYGIQSGQVRVLRTIGINVQFQQSYERLAATLNKNVLDLTEQQKAQARLNEVLRVAPQYFGIYESAMTSTGKQLTSLKRYADEARNAIGREFAPALDLGVRGLTDFLKLMAQKPEVGSWGMILTSGAGLAFGAKFMLGNKAAQAIGVGTAMVGGAKMTKDISEGVAEAIKNIMLEVGITVEREAKKPAHEAAIGIISSTLKALAAGQMQWLAAVGSQTNRIIGPTAQQTFMKGLERTGYATPPVPAGAINKAQRGLGGEFLTAGTGVATPTAQKFIEEISGPKQEDAFLRRLHSLDRELALEDTLARARQRYQEVRDTFDTNNLESSYKALKVAESAVEQYKRQADIVSTLDSLHRSVTVREEETFKNTVSWLEKISTMELSRSQQAQAFADIRATMDQEHTAAIWKQSDAMEKLYEGWDKYISDVVEERGKEGIKIFEEQVKRGERMAAVLIKLSEAARDQERSLIEKRADLEGRIAGRAEGPEATYESEIRLAEKLRVYDFERANLRDKEGRLLYDEARRKELMGASELEYSRRLEEAEISRVQRIMDLEQKRFDDLKRSFEGLFDAAFQSARSFFSALKRMLIAAFLTPLKEGLANAFAGAFSGTGGGGGGGGVGGARGGYGGLIGGLFSGMAGGGGVFTSATPGGTPGFAGPVGGGGGGLSALGGFGASARGFGGYLSALGNIGHGGYSVNAMGTDILAPTRGVGGMAGGAMLLGGGLLGALGMARGGTSGIAMTALSGALIGGKFGGWMGAGIGAAAGGVAGLVRSLFKSATEKAKEKIRSAYGVDIKDKGVLQQIVDMAKQSFGGNLDMAIRHQSIRELVELYAMSTGQPFGGIVNRMTSASLYQSGGSLYANPSPGSSAAATSSLVGGHSISSGPSLTIPLQIDSKTVGTVIIQNGRVITQGAITAMRGNSGRRELTALQVSPGLVTS